MHVFPCFVRVTFCAQQLQVLRLMLSHVEHVTLVREHPVMRGAYGLNAVELEVFSLGATGALSTKLVNKILTQFSPCGWAHRL
jgi:hypothetical protein